MEKVAAKTTERKTIIHKIPETLVYEMINGKPVYYKGYKEVINQNKQIEEIMGASGLQMILISLILKYLYKKISDKYVIGTNEIGLHINLKNNLASDIVIFEKEKLYKSKIVDKYIEIPPKIIIEIDTKADLNDFDNVMDYYTIKTNKLFNFGVEKVFWILTTNKHIIEATPNNPWLIKKWNNEIYLFDNLKFSLEQLLKEDGIFEAI